MAVDTRRQEQLQADFAIWYFDMDRSGTQKQWAEDHELSPSTLSIWKSEPWFIAIQNDWKARLTNQFGSVMMAIHKRALNTDDFNNQQVAAARFEADMLGLAPEKKVKVEVDVYTWLKSLPAEEEPDEGVFEALPDGQS